MVGANGIFQYHKPTWDRYSRLMGEELDYHSAHDQAKLTAFIFKIILMKDVLGPVQEHMVLYRLDF